MFIQSAGSNVNFQGTVLIKLPTPRYILRSSVYSVNEGSSVTFTLSTTNVANGTFIPYVVTGISAGDLSYGTLTGNFVVLSGASSMRLTLSNDALTEGTETLVMRLSTGITSVSAAVTVNDTSKAPTYSLSRSTNVINEGSSVTFTLSTTNVANGTTLPYVVTGISAGDLSYGTLSGTFIVLSGIAVKQFTLSNDALTEGTETLVMRLSTNVASVSAAVTIIDTSKAPTYSLRSNLSAVNEGSSVTFTLSTTNVANGTTLPYVIRGISAGDLSYGSLSGNFMMLSGIGTTTITLCADHLTEGTEIATLTLTNSAASVSVPVIDSSL